MKRIFAYVLLTLFMAACVSDDKYSWDEDFADKTATDTIRIGLAYNGATVLVTGDDYGFVNVEGADVTVHSGTNKFLQLTLSGSTADGSLLIYSWRKLGVVLDNVTIVNPDGPAINNQCGKAFYVTLADGTTNTLTDGEAYSVALDATGDTIDQKATLFSEGQVYFDGTGSLTVNGKAKNGIASDDYVVINGGTITVKVESTGSNGIKVNDGFTIIDGILNVSVAADGARGIRSEARTTISGGQTTIITSGGCVVETIDGVEDASSAAGIKSDSLFTMTAGTLTITSSGDGGKGINCADSVKFSGGTLEAITTGTNDKGKPKAVKSDVAIILSGGSFTAKCEYSWACDNGYEADEDESNASIASKMVTILGEAQYKLLKKKEMIVKF